MTTASWLANLKDLTSMIATALPTAMALDAIVQEEILARTSEYAVVQLLWATHTHLVGHVTVVTRDARQSFHAPRPIVMTIQRTVQLSSQVASHHHKSNMI